jgi:hypothetical protein
LPEIGDEGGHDDDGQGLQRGHRHGEETDRDGGQPKADHALHEAGEAEDGGDEKEHGDELGRWSGGAWSARLVARDAVD